ncbi:hypothetical protein AAFF_G00329680 [Aldrovandia affinis]|uniref:Uncharacterized protein n=1 Tax=Aldrovandia affinis TaxID=143900 RepID=A0AAD7SLU6_9TELE|nr:hypothetical protein AAFF_G00329680 [Aldrovandia affinis]
MTDSSLTGHLTPAYPRAQRGPHSVRGHARSEPDKRGRGARARRFMPLSSRWRRDVGHNLPPARQRAHDPIQWAWFGILAGVLAPVSPAQTHYPAITAGQL